jgi:hypothetical protein
MKKLNILLVMALMLAVITTSHSQTVDSTTLNVSNITNTVTLNASTVYIMKGYNYVKNGGNLVIPAGTIILGEKATNLKGVLIVERGGKIHANGTASQPIVFTSRQPVGQRAPGDWGGIILLGRSGINTASGSDSAEIEGFGAGQGPIYGGQPRIDDDSSGVMRYVRIEFSGINLTGVSGNEINGLTMGGVGSKTVIEYIQVSYCGDDSFEWFGGNVNCKYLISYKSVDDDWDCDNGFRGRVQFGLSVVDSSIFDQSTTNGFEIDNNTNSPTSGSFNSPRTRPIFSNMTVIGPYSSTGLSLNSLHGRGGHWRRASLPSAFNTIMMGWKVGLRLDGSGVQNAAGADTIMFRYSIFAGNLRLGDSASGNFRTQAWLQNGAHNNSIFASANDVQLTNPFAIYPDGPTGPVVDNWMPLGGSPALTGANFSDPVLAGFEVVTFKGAFGTTNWAANWAVFNPINYVIGIQQISSNVPESFNLSQNYPNPFNPVTNIKFDIPQNGFVTLKVYNAIGEEVRTLANQNLATGTYRIDFDASALPSGVYFYRLNIEGANNSWAETKKMMLVK